MQPVDTHNSALRSSASHTGSGGGEISSEIDPSLSSNEVLCEQLFERIRKALVLDERPSSPKKHGKRCISTCITIFCGKAICYMYQLTVI